MLIEAIHRYAEAQVRPIAHDADETGEIPDGVLRAGWEIGLIPAALPEKYGGLGEHEALTGVLAAEELAWGDLALAFKLLAPALFAYPVLMAARLGLTPVARFVGFAVAGVRPEVMGIGPVEAVPRALRRAGLTLGDIDLIELNEAFASQSVAVIRELGLDPAIVNVNGGAIALGHPLGATGAKLTVQLLHELRRRGGRYGLVTMCVGGGMGAAGLFERLS